MLDRAVLADECLRLSAAVHAGQHGETIVLDQQNRRKGAADQVFLMFAGKKAKRGIDITDDVAGSIDCRRGDRRSLRDGMAEVVKVDVRGDGFHVCLKSMTCPFTLLSHSTGNAFMSWSD